MVFGYTNIINRDIAIEARGCWYGVSQQVFPVCAQGNNAMSNSGHIFENLYDASLCFPFGLCQVLRLGFRAVTTLHRILSPKREVLALETLVPRVFDICEHAHAFTVIREGITHRFLSVPPENAENGWESRRRAKVRGG